MQITLSDINTKEFFTRPCVIAGVPCVLVEPLAVGIVKWTRDNLHLRSSIWTMGGELVSAGFPKFFNFDEDIDKDGNYIPDKIPYPKPKDLRGAEIFDKLDGSLLIISFFKGEMIVRTRGTISAEDTLGNGDEIPTLKEKYKTAFSLFEEMRKTSLKEEVGASYLFEWYSPRNKIVLDYGDEPQLWLVGAVNHDEYSLGTQEELDLIAEKLQMPRPERYSFKDMTELRAVVETLEGKEGVCVYYNGGQNILKLKSAKYLYLHYYKADVSTPEKVIDLWLEFGQPSYADFYEAISTKYDYEIAVYAKGFMSKICDASKELARLVEGFHNFIEKNQLATMPRKQAAEIVFASYGKESNRAAMIFKLLDGKELDKNAIKKLIWQILKK